MARATSSSCTRSYDGLKIAERPAPPFDDVAADHYGMIRSDLERAGTPMGSNDLMIASIARSRDLAVVTHNCREFDRIVGLRVEDWHA